MTCKAKCNKTLFSSQKKYRSDLNWMKGVGWETTGSLDIQQARKATDLASEVQINLSRTCPTKHTKCQSFSLKIKYFMGVTRFLGHLLDLPNI